MERLRFFKQLPQGIEGEDRLEDFALNRVFFKKRDELNGAGWKPKGSLYITKGTDYLELQSHEQPLREAIYGRGVPAFRTAIVSNDPSLVKQILDDAKVELSNVKQDFKG